MWVVEIASQNGSVSGEKENCQCETQAMNGSRCPSGPFSLHSASTFAKSISRTPNPYDYVLSCCHRAPQPASHHTEQTGLFAALWGRHCCSSEAKVLCTLCTACHHICLHEHVHIITHQSFHHQLFFQNNKNHVFLPNDFLDFLKVSFLPLALQQGSLYTVWQALPMENGSAQAYRFLNGMMMLTVTTIKAKWPSLAIQSSAVAWHLLLCIRHLDMQANYTEDVKSFWLLPLKPELLMGSSCGLTGPWTPALLCLCSCCLAE